MRVLSPPWDEVPGGDRGPEGSTDARSSSTSRAAMEGAASFMRYEEPKFNDQFR